MSSTTEMHPIAGVLGGALLTFTLTGLSFPEYTRYFETYTTDSRALKTMVGGFCVLDFIHAIMVVHLSFNIASDYFPSTQSIDVISSFQIIVAVVRIASIIAHLFFFSRIIILSSDKSKIPPCVAGIIFIFQTAMYTATTSATYFDVAFQPFESINMLILSKFTTDAIITGSLMSQLHKKPAGFVSEEGVCDIVFFRYMVNPGLLANLVGLAAVVTAIVFPGNVVSIALFIPLSKMYSSTIVTFLNSREPPSTLAADKEREHLLAYEAAITVHVSKA